MREELFSNEVEAPRVDESIRRVIHQAMQELRREMGLHAPTARRHESGFRWGVAIVSGLLGAGGGVVGSYWSMHADVAAIKQAQVDTRADIERLYRLVEPRYRGSSPDGQ